MNRHCLCLDCSTKRHLSLGNGSDHTIQRIVPTVICHPDLESKPSHYILPSTISSSIYKHSILDPQVTRHYELPTQTSIVTEKFTPGLLDDVPKEDPLRGDQQVGGEAVEMYLSWVMKLRKQKHRKHRIARKRKKDSIKFENLEKIKARKKEASMRAVESEWEEKGESFKAQVVYDERLRIATEGGWQCNEIFRQLKQLELEDRQKEVS